MAQPRIDLLNGLSPAEGDALLSLGSELTSPAGGRLFDLGDTADRLFVLRSGRVVLSLPIKVQGRDEDVTLEERRPGETIGWSGLIPPHRFTLKAVTPEPSLVLTLPRTALFEHFAAHEKVGYVVMRNLAAVIGHRLGLFQTMWLREIQRLVELRYP